MRFLETFKILSMLLKFMVRCVLWTVYRRFLNSIDDIRDKTFNFVCDLDRVLPKALKFLSMPDLPSFGYLFYIIHRVDYSSVSKFAS